MEGGGSAYTQYTLNGLVEYPTNEQDKILPSDLGDMIKAEVKIALNLDDMDVLGLISNDYPILKEQDDYMVVNGESFNVIKVTTDGPMENRNLLVLIFGEKMEKPSV